MVCGEFAVFADLGGFCGNCDLGVPALREKAPPKGSFAKTGPCERHRDEFRQRGKIKSLRTDGSTHEEQDNALCKTGGLIPQQPWKTDMEKGPDTETFCIRALLCLLRQITTKTCQGLILRPKAPLR